MPTPTLSLKPSPALLVARAAGAFFAAVRLARRHCQHRRDRHVQGAAFASLAALDERAWRDVMGDGIERRPPPAGADGPAEARVVLMLRAGRID